MNRSQLVLLLATALSSACATTGEGRSRPEPAPAWTSPEGRLDGRLDMAATMLRAGEAERAMAVLSVARQEAGGSFELDMLQAHAFHALGMVGEAVVLLEPHADRHRKDPDLHHLLGQLYYETGELEAAERALTRAAELAPEDAEIANNLGFLLLVSERPAEAVPWLRRAVSLDPAQQRYRGNLAFALAADGQSEQALQVFRATGPEPLALARLGVAHERAEQRELAIARYHQALQLDPLQPVARSGLERLEPQPDVEAQP
jgi:Flp pilus assembly protein TadD